MVFAVAELVAVALVAGMLVLGGCVMWKALRPDAPASSARGVLPSRERAELAASIARARWQPAHDEVDGATRVLLRRSYVGLDGRPAVLEERVLETFPATDPAWEARFTEGMATARYRCTYLNTEESQS